MNDDTTASILSAFVGALEKSFGDNDDVAIHCAVGEVTLTINSDNLTTVLQTLRDHFTFSQLIDLCGVDYSQYHRHQRKRFAIVYHLLSLTDNQRLRVRTFCPDNHFPLLPSVIDLWPVANWFEREAFDLFGIIFQGHPDLRRLLTDYGFVGHPFRKDFPISGQVEMRYDPQQKRVIYQPVSIEPREVTPRVVRPESFNPEKNNHG